MHSKVYVPIIQVEDIILNVKFFPQLIASLPYNGMKIVTFPTFMPKRFLQEKKSGSLTKIAFF